MIKLQNYQEVEKQNTNYSLHDWEFLNYIKSDKINEDLAKIISFKQQFDKQMFKNIVLIGIGGSMLGPQSIYHILEDRVNDNLNVFFIDNIDSYEINKVVNKITCNGNDLNGLSQTLVITITKTGNTQETMSAFYYFRSLFEKNGNYSNENFIFICNEGGNNLRTEALAINAVVFDIPINLGGRFSVISPVGLVFAALTGLKIDKIVSGARFAMDEFTNNIESSQENILASQLFNAYNNDKKMWVLFPYFKRGQFLAKWYVQLTAESLGKVSNDDNKIISPTPISAVGATDQHSILQLFEQGLNDKYYIFLKLNNISKNNLIIPNIKNADLTHLSGLDFNVVLNTQLQATSDSLLEGGRSVSIIEIDTLNEEMLGYLFVFFEITTSILGDLFDINTFNQPGVERSKVLTKKYLTKNNPKL